MHKNPVQFAYRLLSSVRTCRS